MYRNVVWYTISLDIERTTVRMKLLHDMVNNCTENLDDHPMNQNER
jgi:hypothetical protein